MKHLTLSAFGLLAITALFSCKKDKENPPPAYRNTDEYTRLQPGNYWIYQIVTVDTTGAVVGTLPGIDSVFVEKDTLIHGHTYHKLCKPQTAGSSQYTPSYLRDSLGYLVNEKGRISFSASNFSGILDLHYFVNPPDDTFAVMHFKMTHPDKIVSVPAGTFRTMEASFIYSIFSGQPTVAAVRTTRTTYSLGRGVITEQLPFYMAMPTTEERRLLRSKVQ